MKRCEDIGDQPGAIRYPVQPLESDRFLNSLRRAKRRWINPMKAVRKQLNELSCLQICQAIETDKINMVIALIISTGAK